MSDAAELEVEEGSAFGGLLRRHRLKAKLSQAALAARSGLSTQAIGALERGTRRRPYRVTVDMLAGALSLTAEERKELADAARGRFPPRDARALPAGNHNVPVQPTPLIGREEEVRLAAELLRRPDVRLLTLSGCPGVGKTRLAIAVATRIAADFPDGVFLVHLASLGDPDLVASAIRQVLDSEPQASRGSPADLLAADIGSRRVLLLLDNFEHLLPAAPLLAELIGRCPGLDVLVTSRATLHLRCEHQLQVLPLPVPDSLDAPLEVLAGVPSVALFVQRANARSPGFRLVPANAQAVARLCTRLDGLPLALELTAAWIPLLSPGQLLEHLEDCLRVEMGGPQDMPEHQRTIRATLEWSYGLLSEREQALFRRLSVFAGGSPLEAVQQVCQAAGAVDRSLLTTLNALVDKNVALCEGDGDGPRIGMLEVMRSFGQDKLVANEEAEVTARAHAEWCLALADTAERALKGRDQLAWIDRLEVERDNLRAAMGWARDHGHLDLGLAIAGRLWRVWERRGPVAEGLAWLDDLLDRDGEVALETRARALNAAGNLSRWIDYRARAERYSASLELYRRLGDREGVGRLLNNLGMVAQDRHDHAAAVSLFEESLAIFRMLGDDYGTALSLCNFAVSAVEMGDLQGAGRMFEEANSIRRSLGDSLGLARSLMGEGRVLMRTGARARAEALMEESLALCRVLDDQPTLAYVLARRGEAARFANEWQRARADYAAALRIAQRVGARRVAIMCIEGLAAVAASQRAMEFAALLYGAADTMRGECGMPQAPPSDPRQAAVEEALLDGDVSRAWAHGRALSPAQAIDDALAWGGDG